MPVCFLVQYLCFHFSLLFPVVIFSFTLPTFKVVLSCNYFQYFIIFIQQKCTCQFILGLKCWLWKLREEQWSAVVLLKEDTLCPVCLSWRNEWMNRWTINDKKRGAMISYHLLLHKNWVDCVQLSLVDALAKTNELSENQQRFHQTDVETLVFRGFICKTLPGNCAKKNMNETSQL